MICRNSGAVSLAFLAMVTTAWAKDIPASWHGAWSNGVAGAPRVLFRIEPGDKISVALDGQAVPVTSFQMSPDRRTAIVYWDQGEGTLIWSDDESVVAGIFDRRISLRTVVLRRER